MEERLDHLFRLVVEEYVSTAEPVGSQALVERYKLDVSPATVRNWFAALDERGLLMQPHTSGGRIPTEAGFARYVEQWIVPRPAGKRARDRLATAADAEEDRKLKMLARELAELSGLASIVAHHGADTYYTGLSSLFGQPEFRDWQRVVDMSELLDHLDETLSALRQKSFPEPQIMLGKECPFGPACGSVIASVPGGMIGVLGPLRMDYQDALSNLLTSMEMLGSNE
jgi:heat-inducible transcriptional repressor